MTLSAMVLAAGEGTRMRSTRPKPLHLLCGRPMLLHVLAALSGCDINRTVVVVGHGAEAVTKKVQELGSSALRISFVEQLVQRGTGDAVLVGMTAFIDDDLDESGDLLVLPGDTPLLRCETVAALVRQHRETGAAATLLTARLQDPTGYGRISRDRNGNVARVVEHGDATPEELEIDEINTSIYCFRRDLLAPALRRLSPENAQGEYYLTDVVSVLHDAGYPVGSFVIPDAVEVRASTIECSSPRPRPSCEPARTGVARGGRDDGRPGADLRGRDRRSVARRHPLPGHDPARRDDDRPWCRDRAVHPTRRHKGRSGRRSSPTPSLATP